MKLSYWYSQCPDDAACYSIREKTKKGAIERIAQQDNAAAWPTPRKVTVEYKDGFDLMFECSHEGHHWWEY